MTLEKQNAPRPRGSTFFACLRGDRQKLLLFSLILAFSFFSKLPRLSKPADFYFDEVYHGFTATVYLHGDKVAYDPWAKPPEGKAYEWTHPPFSKLIMAGMMGIFGENAFGWRIGSVLTGTGATVATAVLSFELFPSVVVALLAMALMSMETLVFAQSRIAMNDAYLVFFMLLTFISYVRWRRNPASLKYLYLTGFALGLTVATKWTAFYVLAILLLDQGREVIWKGKFPKTVALLNIPIALLVLPALLYLASYTQFFILGSGWSDFLKLQDQMWSYHTGLTATHAYSSKPWQWLLNTHPVWFYVDYSVPGKVAHMYNIGNSVILYAGLFAVFSMLFREKKSGELPWEKWFVLLIYFGLWVPWVVSPRIMLFYHYMPAIPALCIILARWLNSMLEDPSPERPRIARLILVGSFVWMITFYPLLTGVHLPKRIGDFAYSILSK